MALWWRAGGSRWGRVGWVLARVGEVAVGRWAWHMACVTCTLQATCGEAGPNGWYLPMVE